MNGIYWPIAPVRRPIQEAGVGIQYGSFQVGWANAYCRPSFGNWLVHCRGHRSAPSAPDKAVPLGAWLRLCLPYVSVLFRTAASHENRHVSPFDDFEFFERQPCFSDLNVVPNVTDPGRDLLL